MRRLYLGFALATLIPMVILGATLSSHFSDRLMDQTLESYTATTESTFRLVSDSLIEDEDFRTGMPPMRRALYDQLLVKLVDGSTDPFVVRLLAPSGKVIYSSDAAEIDDVLPVSRHRTRALAGESFARISDGGQGSILGTHGDQIELYLPVRLPADDTVRKADPDPVVGLIEAGGLSATLAGDIARDVSGVQWAVAGGLGGLWVLLLPLLAWLSGRFRRQAADNEYLALHDTLTGLPNRNLLADRVKRELAVIERSHRKVGMLLLDLDRFKEINDSLGHGKGDLILKQVAERVQGAIRPYDTVARLGGDEFAVVVCDAPDLNLIAGIAQRITDALAAPFRIDELDVFVEASIGISMGPDQGTDGGDLLQHADIAMYAAKEAGLDYLVYSSDIDFHSPSRLALAADLRRALEGDLDELQLHFQPLASADSHEVRVMEALIRWDHPTRGLLVPDTFIPLAEQSGLIRRLTTLVLERAVAEARGWQDAGFGVSVAVNLSARNLQELDLPDRVQGILEAHGLPAHRLELEITETGVLANPEVAMELIARLRQLGVRIALDDFGTGYSSLTYLKDLAADQLKIDRSFVNDMIDDDTNLNIVRSVIDLAHSLQMGVTAEGVETADHWERLTELRCDLIQGFFLAQPLDSEHAAAFLADHQRRPSHARVPVDRSGS